MADGVIAAARGALPVSLSSSAGLTHPFPAPASAAMAWPLLRTGASAHTIVSQSVRSRIGALARSFADDYFNRMYLSATEIVFASEGSSAASSLTIWNASTRPVQVLSITDLSPQAIYTSGISVPSSIGGFSTETLTLTLDPVGPSRVSTRMTIGFDIREPAVVSVLAERVKLFPHSPNWASTVSASYGFKTDIITSRDGTEQRRALRNDPRRSVSFSTMLNGASLLDWSARLASWQAYSFVLPEIGRRELLTDDMPAGSSTAKILPLPSWAVPGARAVLSDSINVRSLTIRQVDPASGLIGFQQSVNVPFAAGSSLTPALFGRLATSLNGTLVTNTAATAQVEFSAYPGLQPPLDPGSPGQTFSGREVFHFLPNWIDGVPAEYRWEYEALDYEIGRVRHYVPVKYGSVVTRPTFMGYSDEIDPLVQFFLRHKGQARAFYMPTGGRDIEPVSPVIAGTNTLVSHKGALLDFVSNPVWRAICVRLKDGTLLTNRVGSIVSIDADTVALVGDFAWTQGFNPSDVAVASWMPLCRFASDGLTVEYHTDRVAVAQISIRTLKDL